MDLEKILAVKKLLDEAAVPQEDRMVNALDENGEPVVIDLAMVSLANAVDEGKK